MRLVRTRRSRRLVRKFSYWIPRTRWLQRLCKLYLDNYYGDNNADMLCNGEIRFLKKALSILSRGSVPPVILDVGANRGQWCAEVLAVNPNARIDCFEPASATWERLQAAGFPSNVRCHRLALGSAKGTLKLRIVAPGSELNSFHSGSSGDSSGEEVNISTVDEHCLENGINEVAFLKIDAEGHDFHVLKGALTMLQNNRIGIVQFEYGGGYIAARVFLSEVFDFLKPLAYDIYKIFPNGLLPVSNYSPSLERFENANLVLVSREFAARDELIESGRIRARG